MSKIGADTVAVTVRCYYEQETTDRAVCIPMRNEEKCDSYAREFIEGLRRQARCDWCGRDAKLTRKKLCRHCNDIQKRIEQLEEKAPKKSRPNFLLDWDLKVARAEKKDCIAWGEMLKTLLVRVDALDLEHWFCMLAKRIARDKRMHYNTATMLGWTFTAEQRQVLAYLFWETFGAEASHNRKERVQHRAVLGK
jgi:hypothetical protein